MEPSRSPESPINEPLGAPKGAPSARVDAMPYRLRDDLSCCQTGGHLVFLDLRNDRYFRLSKPMECALISALQEGNHSDTINDLIQHNILVRTPVGANARKSNAIEDPERSAIEEESEMPRIRPIDLAEVFSIVTLTYFQLRTMSLKRVLDLTVSRRMKHTTRETPPPEVPGNENGDLAFAACVFLRARLLVPIDTCCLLDSIGLAKFLFRRNLAASLVFGVMGDPFAAHCWIQNEDLILNDTVGNATSYTRILVI